MIDKDKIIERDYSRKPYRADKRLDYAGVMRKITAKSRWNSVLVGQPGLAEFTAPSPETPFERANSWILRQSEFKKPYKQPDYGAMETDWDGVPGVPYFDPIFPDHPWVSPWPLPVGEHHAPGYWVLHAYTEYKYCPGSTKNIVVRGSEPIYDVKIKFPNLYPGTSVSIKSGRGTNAVTVAFTAESSLGGIVAMSAYEEASDAPPQPSSQGRGWTDFSIDKGSIAALNPIYNDYDLRTECAYVFWFGLYRDDGDLVDSGNMSSSDLVIKRVADGVIPPYESGFDSDSNLWWIWLKEHPDENGYWVKYGPDDWSSYFSLQTQYPYRYKLVDMENAVDAIFPDPNNVYFDHVPVWAVNTDPDYRLYKAKVGSGAEYILNKYIVGSFNLCYESDPVPGEDIIMEYDDASASITTIFAVCKGAALSSHIKLSVVQPVFSSVPYGVEYHLNPDNSKYCRAFQSRYCGPDISCIVSATADNSGSDCSPSAAPFIPELTIRNIKNDVGTIDWTGSDNNPTLVDNYIENNPQYISAKEHAMIIEFGAYPPSIDYSCGGSIETHDLVQITIGFERNADSLLPPIPPPTITSPRDMP